MTPWDAAQPADDDQPSVEPPDAGPASAAQRVVDDRPASPLAVEKPKRMGRADQQAEHLRALSLAIEIYPEAAVNYLLRGELFIERGEYHLAEADLLQAVQHASAALATSSWGVVEQSIIDRALRAYTRIKAR